MYENNNIRSKIAQETEVGIFFLNRNHIAHTTMILRGAAYILDHERKPRVHIERFVS